MTIYDSNYRLYRPYMSLTVHNRGTINECRTGIYTFSNGVVNIYADEHGLFLDMVFNGIIWRRYLEDKKKAFTDRRIAHQARIFANQIINR